MDYDVIIIGAGVVGLACAEQMSKRFGSILVIERHGGFGMETSSRNSEVIHSGIYYPENSLKARLCVAGNKSLYRYCRQNNIPHRNTGKYIIARNEDEIKQLDKIFINARNNGVKGLRHVSQAELSREEPFVNAVAALFSPDTGIVDSHSLMSSLEANAKKKGCDFAYMHTVVDIEKVNNGFLLLISAPDKQIIQVECSKLINAAGLDSDTIAEMSGIDLITNKYNLHYCRGHYYKISSRKKYLTKHLIYPVPNKDISGLGIHVTIDMAGELKLGPDTQYLNNREKDYNIPGYLNNKFYASASSYLPDLEPEDISPDQSGIRPKLQGKNEEFRDFIIKEESVLGLNGLINLIGIESPGLTCSLEIAKMTDSFLA